MPFLLMKVTSLFWTAAPWISEIRIRNQTVPHCSLWRFWSSKEWSEGGWASWALCQMVGDTQQALNTMDHQEAIYRGWQFRGRKVAATFSSNGQKGLGWASTEVYAKGKITQTQLKLDAFYSINYIPEKSCISQGLHYFLWSGIMEELWPYKHKVLSSIPRRYICQSTVLVSLTYYKLKENRSPSYI